MKIASMIPSKPSLNGEGDEVSRLIVEYGGRGKEGYDFSISWDVEPKVTKNNFPLTFFVQEIGDSLVLFLPARLAILGIISGYEQLLKFFDCRGSWQRNCRINP